MRSRGPALELVFAPDRLAAAELSTIARDASSEALYLDALEERRAVRVRSEIAYELSAAEARGLVARGSLPPDSPSRSPRTRGDPRVPRCECRLDATPATSSRARRRTSNG